MTFQSVWWHPNYVEYASGLRPGKTWPQVMEQYRRPHSLNDLRYYDLPTEEYEAKLYYRLPRLGQPVYRGTFRDKPHTLTRHYPGEDPLGKPPGFHGRIYREDGPPPFKYQGPHQDKVYWLERPPYTPSIPEPHPPQTKMRETHLHGSSQFARFPPSAAESARAENEARSRTRYSFSPTGNMQAASSTSARGMGMHRQQEQTIENVTEYKDRYTNPTEGLKAM